MKNLRKKGILPAVLYGPKIESKPLEVDFKEFDKVLKEAGESTLIKLKIKNDDCFLDYSDGPNFLENPDNYKYYFKRSLILDSKLVNRNVKQNFTLWTCIIFRQT